MLIFAEDCCISAEDSSKLDIQHSICDIFAEDCCISAM